VTDNPKTLTVPEAGRLYFGLGRNASYDAAKHGELPVIKIGYRLRVPVAALEKMLADAGIKTANGGVVMVANAAAGKDIETSRPKTSASKHRNIDTDFAEHT
jgi:hypothetical protein